MKSHNKFLAFSLSALLVAPGILQEVSAAEETGNVEDEITVVADQKIDLDSYKQGKIDEVSALENLTVIEKQSFRLNIQDAADQEAVDALVAAAVAQNAEREEDKFDLDSYKQGKIDEVSALENLTVIEKQSFRLNIQDAADQEAVDALVAAAVAQNAEREEDEFDLDSYKQGKINEVFALENLTVIEKNHFKLNILDAEDKDAVDALAAAAVEQDADRSEDEFDLDSYKHDKIDEVFALENLTVIEKNHFKLNILDAEDKDAVDALVAAAVAQNAEREEDEKEYTVKYELRDKDGNLVKTLQTETWHDWDAMEAGSVATADIFAKTYGKWDVEASADGFVYVFTEKEDEETPEKETFTVKYELRDKDGNLIKTLQTETWHDWDAMEAGSVATANIFAKTYGKWDVEASANGFVYVFTEKEDEETPEKETFTVKYELRDKDGNLVKTLQTETWHDWDAMEAGSVATANIFAKTYGKWDVEASADGFVYVFTEKEDEETPEKETFTVKYELRDKDGNLIKTLQTETWHDWDAMEAGSVATANIFANTYGKWDVEASADGFVYVFTAIPLTPLEPSTPIEDEKDEDKKDEDKKDEDEKDEDKKDEDKKEEDKKDEDKKDEDKKDEEKLPQTGEAENNAVFAGISAIIAGFGGLIGINRRKDYN